MMVWALNHLQMEKQKNQTKTIYKLEDFVVFRNQAIYLKKKKEKKKIDPVT